jgi:DNA processing protein
VDDTFDLLTLVMLRVGARTVRDLSARAPLADALARPDEHRDLLPARAVDAIRSGAARARAEAEMHRAAARGVRVVGRDEPLFPGLLRRIYDPPAVLYVRGRLDPDEGERSVSVVGSRAASGVGQAFARALAGDLAGAGLTVVSGLARGIDSAGHRGALDAEGRTVAVLGSSVDCVYPRENVGLAEAIVAGGGAVVSEFPMDTGPRPGHFPLRNRVIAGWGRAVVVVEAGERSGALGTARVALEEGREVLAVPGHPSHPGAAGTNRLIRDGAVLVRDAGDVAREIGVVIPVTEGTPPGGDDLLDALRRDAPTSLDELQARCGLAIPDLLTHLAELELGDKVRRLPGALFVRS